MEFQYVSDIHLEFRDKPKKMPKIKSVAPYLILAGDIGRVHCDHHLNILKIFLVYCVERWRKVIYVPGNHEFYGVSYEVGISILKKLCLEIGVILLAPGVVKLEGVTIVGGLDPKINIHTKV
jgi:hypothetical protein